MPIRVKSMTVQARRGAYLWTVEPVGQAPIRVACDGNLGHILSAWSAVLKELEGRQTGARRETDQRTGRITINRFAMDPLTVWPWKWSIELDSGAYTFQANVDDQEHSVTSAFAAAARYFGQAYGYCTVLGDETYQTVAADQLGLLNGHAS